MAEGSFIQRQMDKVLDAYSKVWVQELTAGVLILLCVSLFFLPLADSIIQQTPDDTIRIRASVFESGAFELQGSDGDGWRIERDYKEWGDTIFIEKGSTVNFMIFAMDMTHAFQITNAPVAVGLDNSVSTDIDCQINDWERKDYYMEKFDWNDSNTEAFEDACSTPPIFPAEHIGLEITFEVEGHYIYRCVITCSPEHQWMNGHIVVEA